MEPKTGDRIFLNSLGLCQREPLNRLLLLMACLNMVSPNTNHISTGPPQKGGGVTASRSHRGPEPPAASAAHGSSPESSMRLRRIPLECLGFVFLAGWGLGFQRRSPFCLTFTLLEGRRSKGKKINKMIPSGRLALATRSSSPGFTFDPEASNLGRLGFV